MAEQPKQEVSFEIKPTAPKERDTEQYTDISMSNALGVHSTQIHSLRQAVWRRYTAMLLANSIFFALIGGMEKSPIPKIHGAIAGVVLCCIWFSMLVIDWGLFCEQLNAASRFRWTNLPSGINPFESMVQRETLGRGRTLYVLAGLVILLFYSFHIAILLQ